MTTREWTPFVKATHYRSSLNVDLAAFRPKGSIVAIYINNLYQVEVTKYPSQDPETKGQINFIHLSIKRQDRTATHDWRDFQRIKNELCGKKWAAVEIYPPEEFLVDQADQYHLWCFPRDVAINVLPFMWTYGRLLTETSFGTTTGSQRAWYDNEKPPDILSRADMLDLIKSENLKAKAAKDE